MLLVSAPQRIKSKALVERLGHIHHRVMDHAHVEYVRPGRRSREEQEDRTVQRQPLAVVKGNIDPEMEKLVLENRARITERFTLRTSAPRRSIRVTERSIGAPAAPTVAASTPTVAPRTLFTNIIDTIVQYSLGSLSTEPLRETYKVSFEIAWQLHEFIQQELEGDLDLGPVLTITGKENAWATTCHEYVKTTWNELGEQLLAELEMLLGKVTSTTG
jgi:hypothetical protein